MRFCFLSILLSMDSTIKFSLCVRSSALIQRVAINEIAESIMAFNTNYKDTGLFGVYAVAKVNQT